MDVGLHNRPQKGMLFNSEEDAYNFYNEYGRTIGFSIRRSCVHRNNKDDPTLITHRRFVCNKEGTWAKDKRDIDTKKPRAETRTNCLARMSISLLLNGKFECREFVEEHNHILHTAATAHLMRSQRQISAVHVSEIDMADDTRIRPKSMFDYMGVQVGGRENLGYTGQDQKNYLCDKRRRNLSYGEAGSLLKYFENQTKLNPSFTYALQLDAEEQITNIFWADPRMIIDYAHFGEVVSFDTTFCTNNEYRPLGIFAGFNHHKGIVFFGAALLYDETAESFKWLFETFLQAHGQKKPVTLFTDQDAEMLKVIPEVFQGTRHGFCTWHIMQNGIKHLGNLMKDGSPFLTDLKRCIFEYEDELQFENAWGKLYIDYQIENTSWLDCIYGLKEKWAHCYMKNTFTLGIRSTQLSESINSDLKDYLKPTLDIVRFFTQFERVVEDKRANELQAEFEARNKLPRNLLPKSPILKQVETVYTPYTFEVFQEEYTSVSAYYVKFRNEGNALREYVVSLFEQPGDFTVWYNPYENVISCSCRKFETIGILCCHTLKILDVLDIKKIPEAYILKRWTRAARSITVEDWKRKEVLADVRLDYTNRFRFLCPKYVELISQACISRDGFDVALNNTNILAQQLQGLVINREEPNASDEGLHLNKEIRLKKKEKQKGGKRLVEVGSRISHCTGSSNS